MIFQFRQPLSHSTCPKFLSAEWDGSRLRVPLEFHPNEWPPFLGGYPNESGISLLIKRCIYEYLQDQGIALDVGDATIVEGFGSGRSKPGGWVHEGDEYYFLKHIVGIETKEKNPITGDFRGVLPATWNGRELIYGSQSGDLLFCSEKLVRAARDQQWPYCHFYVAQADSIPNSLVVRPIRPTAKQWPPEGLAEILS